MFITRKIMLTRFIVAAAIASAALPAAAASPPASDFFQKCALSYPAISPDGSHVLASVAPPGEHNRLVVVELASMKPTVVARFDDADVSSARWLNDGRIAYVLWKTDLRVTNTLARIIAVNRDGSDTQSFSGAIVDPAPFLSYCGALGSGSGNGIIAPFDGNSDDMLVRGFYDNAVVPSRMNTQNGAMTPVIAPPRAISWLFDEHAALRVVVTREGDLHALHVRDDQDNWRKVSTFADTPGARIQPALYAGKTLYVHARNGGDKRAVYRYNLERGALEGEALVSSPDYDLSGAFVTDARKALGYRYLTDAFETVWFDKDMQALQKEVDALFPDTVNTLTTGSRSKTPFVLVGSASAMQPVVFRIYNRSTKVVASLGPSRPAIKAAAMANMEMKHYKARDGLVIPAFLTLPPGPSQKNLPAMIIVKPDPWTRSAVWGWAADVQFLASRGYAVLQPEARGSYGFGAAFYAAGTKQWGRAMQDDLADGAKWLVQQGIADPSRICIMGGGYGGYAATMGLINDSNLFRCAISLNGIADLEKTVTRPLQELGTTAELHKRIGDPKTDAAQLRATSPMANAARIRKPVLLAYGAHDSAVPAADGQALFDAIKPGNPAAELHLFDQKGQRWPREDNATVLWQRIEQFLEKHNGKP
jgi:dipeptidyl aminopeptidase/acylaminoacyl peptidase